MKKKQIFNAAALLIGLSAYQPIEDNQIKKPNILFIAVDDLRPELGCYGKSWIKSPNIDALASEGVVFQRAYCNIPVCGASRASILSGVYPTRTRFTNYSTRVDEDMAGIVTLPQNFKESGYQTFSFGKVFHHPDDAAIRSWSETPWRPDYPTDIYTQEGWRDYQSNENIWTYNDKSKGGAAGPAWEKAEVQDDNYYDGKTANKVVDKLRTLANSEKPFFVAVGFLKPHLPFNAPAKYWNLYPHNEIELAPNPFFPENAPKQAKFNFEELRSYTNMPKGDTLVNNEQARWLKHGYFACVSYTDAMIGKVLQALKETGLDKNTIVILWGDHGWSLGEHTHWCKHTCFHNSLQTPLIIKASGFKPARTETLASYIDVYPTLCELAGISKPSHLQGESIVNTMKQPLLSGGEEYCRYPNGESIVTERYVYTQYYNPKTGDYVSRMLYDHKNDPLENVNVADDSRYSEVVKELSKKLRAHVARVN